MLYFTYVRIQINVFFIITCLLAGEIIKHQYFLYIFFRDFKCLCSLSRSPRGTPETKRRQLPAIPPSRPPMSPSLKSVDSAYASLEKRNDHSSSTTPMRRVVSEKVRSLPRGGLAGVGAGNGVTAGSSGVGPASPKTPPQRPPPPKQSSLQRVSLDMSVMEAKYG